MESKAESRVRAPRKPCDKFHSPWEKRFREMVMERGANTKTWGTLKMRGKRIKKMWKGGNLPPSGLF